MRLARIPRPLKILAAVYLAYLALVLLIATPLLNIFAPKIYREQTGRELQLGNIIWLNPFTLELDARNIRSDNPDHSRFWAFDTLNVNISLASIWRGHWVLDALELHGLDLQIDQTAPERFNFSDILDYRAKHFPALPAKRVPAQPEKTTDAQPGAAPFAIEIQRFDFTAKHLGYRAPHTAEPIDATIVGARCALTNFSTVPEKSNEDGTAQPISAATLRGAHAAVAFNAVTVKFLREQYPFTAALRDLTIAIPAFSTAANSAFELSVRDGGSGSVHIQGNAAIAQSNATGQVHVRDLSVLPAWQYLANKLAFDMKSAQLDGDINVHIDWRDKFAYRVQNSQLTLRDAQLQARDDSESRLGFATLQVSHIQVDSAQPRVQAGKVLIDKLSIAGWNKDTQVSLVDMFAFAGSDTTSESPPHASPMWQLQIDDIVAQNSDIQWHASQLEKLPLTLAPLNIHASNLHWPDAAPLQIEANTALNNTAQLTLNGAITPRTQSGELHADVRNLPLAWGNSLVERHMRATIAAGALNAQFAVTLDNAQPVRVQSEGAIDQFELQALVDKRKLAAWKKMQWRQLALEVPQQRIDIKRVIFSQPWVQFRINADGTTNFQQLLVEAKNIPPEKSASPKKPALTPNPSRLDSSRPAGRGEKPWRFALDNIHIDNASIDFRDASLTSAFRTNITALSGDIDGLASSAKNAARVGLHGTVDGYAPVALTGKVDPFATKPMLNVTLDMTNLDLATLTPYSGTYAGYQIDGGRLTVQLAYTLQDGRIKGSNHIVVNQMQLGKQVSGPKVMDLPLRFAIYLLTDADGVLDLGVDVTGDVDDPDFSVSGIIWKAFRNLIVKTVTSPFRALAHLVGAGSNDNLDRVEFAAGSDHIDDGETQKLKTLSTALQEKSALKLSISGHVSPSRDIEALHDEQLSRTLIEQGGIAPADIQQQSKNWQREVVKLFKRRFPNEDTQQWQVMQMNDAMRDNEELDPAALQQLAARRALAVKQALVTELGLAADRVFVKPVDFGADKNPGLQATMQVE